MWSLPCIYWLVLLNKNSHFWQNPHFNLSLMTCCCLFSLHMILLLDDLNALEYVNMKTVQLFYIWTNFVFFVFLTKRFHSGPECNGNYFNGPESSSGIWFFLCKQICQNCIKGICRAWLRIPYIQRTSFLRSMQIHIPKWI